MAKGFSSGRSWVNFCEYHSPYNRVSISSMSQTSSHASTALPQIKILSPECSVIHKEQLRFSPMPPEEGVHPIEKRWDKDTNSAIQQIRRSLVESTIVCGSIVTDGIIAVKCGEAVYDLTRGLWSVFFRPVQSPATFLLDQRVIAHLKIRDDVGVLGSLPPPKSLVQSVLKRFELCNMIATDFSQQKIGNTQTSPVCHPMLLRQGQTVTLGPSIADAFASNTDIVQSVVAIVLDPNKLYNNCEWVVMFKDNLFGYSQASQAKGELLSRVENFVDDCLKEIPGDIDDIDPPMNFVSVEALQHTLSGRSDGFASVSSVGDLLSLVTADTAIATDDDSRLTDDGQKYLSKEPKTVVKDPLKKKSNVGARELELIQKDMGRVAPPERNIVQLFASEFSTDHDLTTEGSSKRKIKQVVRFNAAPHSYSLERKKHAASGKTGSGFLCPQCSFHCSYDVHQCLSCDLPCRYVAGTGVVVSRDREEVAKIPPSSIKWELNFCDEEDNKFKNRNVAPGIPSSAKETFGSLRSLTGSGEKRDSNKNPSTTRNSLSASMDNKNKGLECAVCDKCLKIMPLSSLQEHRRNAHKLARNIFGCPYCKAEMTSASGRRDHIEQRHPRKPTTVSKEELFRSRPLTFLCHLCDTLPFTKVDLQHHLRNSHRSCADEISCICPFCPQVGYKLFKTEGELEAHVTKEHKGYHVVGLSLSNSPAPDRKRPRKENAQDEEGNKRFKCIERRQVALKQKQPAKTLINCGKKKNTWKPLSYVAILRGHSEFLSFLNTNDTCKDPVIAVIEEKLRLTQISMSMPANVSKNNDDEKEYTAEIKLYQRGLRERQGKSDSERLEKEKYKAKCEQNILVWKYENRGRQKSKAEIEETALTSRPIVYTQTRIRAEPGLSEKTCFLGDGCSLCNGEYAKCVVTESEIKRAEGDIMKVIPIPLNDLSGGEILSPTFRKIRHDSDFDEEESERNMLQNWKKGGNEVYGMTRGRREERIKKAKERFLQLQEMKTSIDFIQKYNQGLIRPIRGNRKKIS